MKRLALCFVSIFVLSQAVNAKVNVETKFKRTAQGFPQAQVNNLMNTTLACYIRLDGFKKKFVLPPSTTSRWYTASDIRFNYSGFSTWCDYLHLHPEYEKYRTKY